MAGDPQFSLCPELAAIALKDFSETPEKRSTALDELRLRIAALPAEDQLADVSDANLIRFLRARKYDMNKAVASTTKFHKFCIKHQTAIGAQPGVPLKDLVLLCDKFLEVFRDGPAGKVYVVMRPALGIKKFTPELKKSNPRAMMQINFWMFDYLSKDPQAQIAGLCICNTFADLGFQGQMALQNMAPMSDQTATFELFNILGTRLKGAFIFEQPVLMNVIWFLARPFMSKKIQDRFHLCGKDYDQLKTVCQDMSILPAYLGGTLADGYPNFIAGVVAKWQ